MGGTSGSGQTETRVTAQARSAFDSIADAWVVSSLGLCPVIASTSCSVQPSNSMLELRPTTPQDYPEWSGFGRRREREWVTSGSGPRDKSGVSTHAHLRDWQ